MCFSSLLFAQLNCSLRLRLRVVLTLKHSVEMTSWMTQLWHTVNWNTMRLSRSAKYVLYVMIAKHVLYTDTNRQLSASKDETALSSTHASLCVIIAREHTHIFTHLLWTRHSRQIRISTARTANKYQARHTNKHFVKVYTNKHSLHASYNNVVWSCAVQCCFSVFDCSLYFKPNRPQCETLLSIDARSKYVTSCARLAIVGSLANTLET